MAIRVDKVYKKELKNAKKRNFTENGNNNNNPKETGIIGFFNKNKILSIILIILVIGVAIYFIRKRKKQEVNDISVQDTETTD
ncbi:MAG: hypothetical protein WCT85_00695 [Parachlamydiales bacterium]|jgi:hypothetical protein